VRVDDDVRGGAASSRTFDLSPTRNVREAHSLRRHCPDQVLGITGRCPVSQPLGLSRRLADLFSMRFTGRACTEPEVPTSKNDGEIHK
jgi:hypothetical protein